MGGRKFERTSIGGTVRVDVYSTEAERIPIHDTREIIDEEQRTARLLSKSDQVSRHRPKTIRVESDRVVVQAIHGKPVLESNGSSGFEIYSIEDQLIEYVEGLHNLGVAMADVPDNWSDVQAVFTKADRFLVEEGVPVRDVRLVDVDSNGFVSIVLAEKIRATVEEKVPLLDEMEQLLEVGELGNNPSLPRGLEYLLKSVAAINRKKLEQAVIDYEKYKSVGGFIKTILGVRPDDLPLRVEAMQSLREMASFQTSCKLAEDSIGKKHPLMAELTQKVKKFSEHDFRKMLRKAKSGEMDSELLKYWEEYQDIKGQAGEIWGMTTLPQSFFDGFRDYLLGDLALIINEYKLSNDDVSNLLAFNLKEIGRSSMSKEKISEIKKLGKVEGKNTLEMLINDWNMVAVVGCELRRRNLFINENQARDFVTKWKSGLDKIVSKYDKVDLVNQTNRDKVIGELKNTYLRLMGAIDSNLYQG